LNIAHDDGFSQGSQHRSNGSFSPDGDTNEGTHRAQDPKLFALGQHSVGTVTVRLAHAQGVHPRLQCGSLTL